MTDKIINFYDKLGLIKNSNLPKTWKKHHIYNNSMILCLGGTGSGKSNALVNYIQRSSGEFYKIIICSFSTTDEPLYKMLEGKNVELINDIEEVPSLSDSRNLKLASSQSQSGILHQFSRLHHRGGKSMNEVLPTYLMTILTK